jgi:hypothetical protein
MKSPSAFRSRGFALGVAAVVIVSGAAPSAAVAQALPAPPPESAPPQTAPAPAPAPGTEATPAPANPAAPPAAPGGEAAAVPAPAPDATPKGDAEAEAAAMAAVATAEQAETDGYKLNLYGFADTAYTTYFDKGSFGYPVGTFWAGNLNLYAGSELGDNWRTLAEVRFSYLPNGTVPTALAFSPTPPPPTDTTVPDYTDLGRPVRWGGVIIERVYIERTFLSWLTVRAGHFLTPYGIWNVDHGSPVIIGVRRPFIIGEGLLPRSQTGLEAFGGGLAGPFEVGYHLTLSNGRGPTDTYRDMDGNKAIGWRLWARHHAAELGTMTLGFSGYRGQFTNANQVTMISPTGDFSTVLQPTLQYNELSLAADLKWERGGALFQSEFVMNEVAYNNATRPMAFAFAGPPGFVPDNRRWGVYGLGGYRFQFLGIMPWIGGEYYNLGQQGSDAAAIWGGLNIRPTPRVVLKVQLTRSFFVDVLDGFAFKGMGIADFQIAWSF